LLYGKKSISNEVNGYIAEDIENIGQGGGLQGLESKVIQLFAVE
jgi:hypothetical protein